MDNGSIFFIGNVGFSILGPSEFKSILLNEFNKKNTREKTKNVSWRIEYKPTLMDEDVEGRLKKEEGGAFFDTGYSADVDWEKESVIIHYDERILDETLINRIARIWDWSYMSPAEIFIKNTIYDILEPLSHMLMVKNGDGFIHSSAVSDETNEGRSALFTGEGGVGKTALAVQGIKKNLNYMNDDLSLVDEEGFCYHYPKNLQVYGYNVDSHPSLKKRMFQNKSLLNRIMWKLRYVVDGKSGVRRRVGPEVLFGKSITKKSKISKVFFLKSGETLKVKPMDKGRFVDNEIEIIEKEFSDFIDFLQKDDLERYNRFIEYTRKLYQNVYKNSSCFMFFIPDDIDFDKVFDFIERKNLF